MALIEWKPEYSVGDPAVDHEHRELIALVNQSARAILDGRSDAEVERGFGDLLQAVSGHFALEEQQMRAAAYDQIGEHKPDHERLLDQLRDLMDDATRAAKPAADRLVATLEAWFSDHLRLHDARLHGRLGLRPHK